MAGLEVSPAAVAALELAALTLLTAAALTLALRALRGPDWVAMVLDVGIVAISLFFLGGAVILAQRLAVGDSGIERFLALAFPVGDILACSLVLLVLSRAPRAGRAWLSLLAAGFLALALGDTGFAAGRLSNDGGGGLLLAGWPLAWLLFGAAGDLALPGTDRPNSPRKAIRGGILLTVIPLAIAVSAAIPFLANGDYGPVLGFVGVATVMLVIGRQVVTVLDGASVARRLEGEVDARTSELRASEIRFRSLLQGSSDVISLVDDDGMIVYQTPSVERVLGYRPGDYAGRALAELLHPDDVPRARAALRQAIASPDSGISVEWRMRKSTGDWAACETIVRSLLADPDVGGIVLNTRDVSERKVLEEQLIREALHDPLTQLANRALLRDRINLALARTERGGNRVTLLLLDLDDFKAVNDGLGHAAGDTVLQLLSRRLQQCVRPGDTVARLGGDEFAILIEEDGPDPELFLRVAHRVQDALRSPVFVDGHEVFTPLSMGIAGGDNCKDADELVRNADVAMYMAKGRGKNQFALFEPEMHAAMRDRLTLATELRRAVGDEQFTLRYQPVVELATGRVTSAEALVRWNHPERGLVSPAEFIAVAESTGVIVPLGRWIMREACSAAARLQSEQNNGRLAVAINLSARQFQDEALVEDVAAAVADAGLDPWSIILELTETMLMDDIEGAIDTLRALKALGVRLALDDFGTGYSSLSYLRRFPIDLLKIDQSFVAALTTEEGPGLVRSIIRLGETFKLATLAEGVEQPEQLAVLRRAGCTFAQGYLFSKPLKEEQLRAMLAAQNSSASRQPART
jgi:diguanylate cyclase (GGDEF)-like protein/PAS domain S-box-containing protein